MAASTSTIISNTNTITPATQAGSNGPANKMPASEVGWLFVHEYYTFLNKDPSRLHCFYGEKSSLIHGTEGETVTPYQGEKEIKGKFQGLNLENCRVLVTNVDTQASINGGILIQVLGEMSNRNEVARKFAQTFFLDEQPNGQLNCYYVLNDIIRFFSDDDIEIYNGEEEAGASTSPTGTLVEEPINVSRVEQAGPSNLAQNTTITESAQVNLRDMDANISVPSSKENEAFLQTVPVDGEVVDSVIDNDRIHARPPPASALNTNVQPSKLMTNVQSRPPLPSTAQHNGQTNKQESITILTGSISQNIHANGQALSMQSIQTYPSGSQSTPVVSTNIQQPPVIVAKQESATISTSTESQSLQALKTSLSQGNNDQAPKSTTVNVVAASSISTSSPVEQDKDERPSVIISKQKSLTVNSSQGDGKVSSAQNNIANGTQSPVTQNKPGQPANFPAVSTIPQSQVNNQPPIPATNSNVQASSISKLHSVPNNDTQSQAVNTSQTNDQSPKSVTDNNIQLSSSRQKSSSRSEAPGISFHSQLPPVAVVNNKGHQINNTTQVDKKDKVPKNGITAGASDPQKLSDNYQTPQLQAPTKKTWASLAANEPEKWSSNALAEAKGVVASVPAKSVTLQSQSQQMRDHRDRRSEGQKNNSRRNSDTSLSIYVKGVTPSMSYEQLKAAFMVFGQVKHLDVVHTKSCAFVEYNNAESYRRALEVHTVGIGSETVNTEERRPARRNNGKTPRGRF